MMFLIFTLYIGLNFTAGRLIVVNLSWDAIVDGIHSELKKEFSSDSRLEVKMFLAI